WRTNFFFSGRSRHTSFSRDWSSDVCSSDLSRTGKWIFSIRSRLPALAWRIDKIGPQGELVLFPGLVPRPAAAVGCIDELNAEQEIGRASCREREQVSGRAVAPQQRRREHAV